MDDDELAKRRAERTHHPSTLPPMSEEQMLPASSDAWYAIWARLVAVERVVAEVADELDDRGLYDLADQLRNALQ